MIKTETKITLYEIGGEVVDDDHIMTVRSHENEYSELVVLRVLRKTVAVMPAELKAAIDNAMRQHAADKVNPT